MKEDLIKHIKEFHGLGISFRLCPKCCLEGKEIASRTNYDGHENTAERTNIKTMECHNNHQWQYISM